MKIIFAQGNPEPQYAGTRHNVGFFLLDYYAKDQGVAFATKPKFIADIAELSIADEKVLLVRPSTFYNETGRSARAICDFYKCDPATDLLAIHDDLATLRKIIDASPYPHAEIHLTEWNSSWEIFDYTHDALSAATFIAKSNLESIGLVDSLSYWTFTDVFEENRKTELPFHGCFGMINYQQIQKPVFQAYRMMNQLGDRMLAHTSGAIVSRDSATGAVAAMAYNYPPERRDTVPVLRTVEEANAFDQTGSARTLNFTLTGLKPGADFVVETLDRTHGNPLLAWDQMGRPDALSRAQTAALRALALGTKKEIVRADASGTLHVERSLSPWSLVLVTQN